MTAINDTSETHQRSGRQFRLRDQSPLLRAPDDVLIMILEKTSAIDVARMLRISKALNGRLSAIVDRIAKPLLKVQAQRLAQEVSYLDFSQLNSAEAALRYERFFGLSEPPVEMRTGWPTWIDRFFTLYFKFLPDQSARNAANLEVRAMYMVHMYRQTLEAIAEGEDPPDDPDGRYWFEETLRRGIFVDWHLYAEAAIRDMCHADDEYADRLRPMFVYAWKKDLFVINATAATSDRRGSDATANSRADGTDGAPEGNSKDEEEIEPAGHISEEGQQKTQDHDYDDEVTPSGAKSRLIHTSEFDQLHMGHHLLLNYEHVELPRLDRHKPLRYYSLSGHQGLAKVARGSSRAWTPLVCAAVAEDAGVCQVWTNAQDWRNE